MLDGHLQLPLGKYGGRPFTIQLRFRLLKGMMPLAVAIDLPSEVVTLPVFGCLFRDMAFLGGFFRKGLVERNLSIEGELSKKAPVYGDDFLTQVIGQSIFTTSKK